MHTIFVTATGTDVGKTYTSLKLLEHYAASGLRIGAFKPIETGVTQTPRDATALLELCRRHNPAFKELTTEDICPLQFPLPAAPHVAAQGGAIDLAPVYEKFTLLKSRCDLLLVEGAGGIMVPIQREFFMIDLIEALHATPLLVTHDRLGCISDTLVNLTLLRQRFPDADWCVNLRDEAAFERVTAPFYRDFFGHFATLQHDLETVANRLISR